TISTCWRGTSFRGTFPGCTLKLVKILLKSDKNFGAKVRMNHPDDSRPPVRNKRESLFVTGIVDMIYAGTGMSTVAVLERLGVAVDFPMSQTCCGQMGFNAGYRDDARAVARHFLT